MSIQEIAVMTGEAQQAARRLFMVNENLGKYVSTAKAAKLDLANLKKLKRVVDVAEPDLSNLKNLKRTADSTKKIAEETKKVADKGKVLWDNLLKKVPGGATPGGATKAGGTIGSLILIGGVAAIATLQTLVSEFSQKAQESRSDNLDKDLTTVNGLVVKVGLQVKKLESDVARIDKDAKATKDKLYAETGSAVQNATKAREKANDALYETRKGREILETKLQKAEQAQTRLDYAVKENIKKIDIQIQQQKTETRDIIQRITGTVESFRLRIGEAINTANNALTN